MYKVLTFIMFISAGFANQTNCLDRQPVGPETQHILDFYKGIGRPISDATLAQAQAAADREMLDIENKGKEAAARYSEYIRSTTFTPRTESTQVESLMTGIVAGTYTTS